MTKALAFAALLLSACATDGEISGGPARDVDFDVQGVGGHDVARVTGVVQGVSEGRVVLGNDTWLESREISGGGGFAFEGVPDGTYFAKLEIAGYATTTQTVTVTGGAATVTLTATPLPTGAFFYQWSRDASRGGHEQGSAIGTAKATLRDAYAIELSDEDQAWTDEHAARLLQTLRTVPQPASAAFAPTPLAPTTWVLASGAFARTGDVIHVPATSFATRSGGRFYARNLHTEIVRVVTHDGRDRTAVDRILAERYGVRAWLFDNAEIVELISRFEDMPARLRAMSSLKTVIRRIGGAPARASVSDGYLEIADTSFTIDRADAQHALVREKARFVVTPELQLAWGAGDLAEAIADYVITPNAMSPEASAMMSGLQLEPERPITNVAIQAKERTVTVELGLSGAGASSAAIYLFNEAGYYTFLSLNPTTAAGEIVRGEVTLPQGGTWRPDVIVLRDRLGVPSVRDLSEAGWKLEVE